MNKRVKGNTMEDYTLNKKSRKKQTSLKNKEQFEKNFLLIPFWINSGIVMMILLLSMSGTWIFTMEVGLGAFIGYIMMAIVWFVAFILYAKK